MDGKSLSPRTDKLNQLKQILPEVFSENKIDWEKLQIALGEEINFANERYVLNWAGKSDAFRLMQQPTTKTLMPIRDESVSFDDTQNIFIEGDNLDVLKILQKSYFGKVKMIYIDPPYNTGNDSFIYSDRFSETKAEYQKRIGDKDDKGYVTSEGIFRKNSRENGQYHSNWLNMMMPRLYLARTLLRDDGVILINMDENEIVNLSYLMNEIFGKENDLGTIVWDKRNPKGDAKGIAYQHEYIVVYAKNIDVLKSKHDIVRPKKNAQKILDKAASVYAKKLNGINLDEINAEFQAWIREQKELSGGESAYNKIDENGDVFRLVSMAWPNKKKAPDEYFIPLIHPITQKECPVPARGWRNPPSTMNELLKKGEIIFGVDETTQPNRKYLLKENMFENIPSLLYFGGSDVELLNELQIPFETPKVVEIVKEHIMAFTDKDEKNIILDFFAGSATTAHAVMQLNKEDGGNRRYILVQMPEICDEKSEAFKAGYKTIADIAKERIRRAGHKITSSDSIDSDSDNVDIGFKVFKLSDSNFKQWQQPENYSTEALAEQLKLFVDPVAEHANLQNMVYELLLKSGKDLNVNIETCNGYYLIEGNELAFILEKVDEQIITEVLSKQPKKVIALDRIFKGNDQLKTNTALQMKDAGVEFKTI
jgi:adenine-specific DNA-methyltransferase